MMMRGQRGINNNIPSELVLYFLFPHGQMLNTVSLALVVPPFLAVARSLVTRFVQKPTTTVHVFFPNDPSWFMYKVGFVD
jgi:hypothetical protein